MESILDKKYKSNKAKQECISKEIKKQFHSESTYQLSLKDISQIGYFSKIFTKLMIELSEIGLSHHIEDIIKIGLNIKSKLDGFTLEKIFSDKRL